MLYVEIVDLGKVIKCESNRYLDVSLVHGNLPCEGIGKILVKTKGFMRIWYLREVGLPIEGTHILR